MPSSSGSFLCRFLSHLWLLIGGDCFSNLRIKNIFSFFDFYTVFRMFQLLCLHIVFRNAFKSLYISLSTLITYTLSRYFSFLINSNEMEEKAFCYLLFLWWDVQDFCWTILISFYSFPFIHNSLLRCYLNFILFFFLRNTFDLFEHCYVRGTGGRSGHYLIGEMRNVELRLI